MVFVMVLSRCCKDSVFVVHDYYVCENCHFACDTIFSLTGTRNGHDAGHEGKVKAVTGAA